MKTSGGAVEAEAPRLFALPVSKSTSGLSSFLSFRRASDSFFLSVLRVLMIQGQSRQTGFLKLAGRDRNMQVRFYLKLILKS